MTPDEVISNQELFKNDRALFNESLKLLAESALVEKFLKGDERPCNETDFLETKENREKITSNIKTLIKSYMNNCASCKNEYLDIENELLASILILCGQNVTLNPWNTEATVKNCEDILAEILKHFNSVNMSDFISKNFKINLIKVMFQLLCPDLKLATWKYFPASVACYEWILKMIRQPCLSQHLPYILPPALLLTDDYISENKITGTRCLKHIVENITVAELQLCGHGNVIYSALIPLLRIRETDLIYSTVPPLISLTTKLEFDLGKKDITKWSKFDDILEIFLENMEMEQLISLRYCYISNLGFIINASGFRIIRWSKRLLRIFREYIETAKKYNDEKTTNCCVKVIENYIELSSEVISLYVPNLLGTLLYALHYTRNSNNHIQNESKDIAVRCVKILLKSTSESERAQLEKIFQEKLEIDVNFEP